MHSQIAEIASTFDRVADKYDAHLPYFTSFAEDLVAWRPPQPGIRVLDLCTGHGACLMSLGKSYEVSLAGLDISAGMLTSARARCLAAGLDVVLLKADAHCLPFRDGFFDAFYCSLSWQFLLQPERVALELRRTGKPGTQFALSMLGEAEHNWPFLKEALTRHAASNTVPASPACGGPQDVMAFLKSIGWHVEGSLMQRREFEFSSAEHWLAWQWSHYGRRHFDRVNASALPTLTEQLLLEAESVHRRGGLRIAQTVHFISAVLQQPDVNIG